MFHNTLVVGSSPTKYPGRTLEPTTKVLWNMGVSDQPTSSDTRARAQKVLFDQLVGVAKSAAARNS